MPLYDYRCDHGHIFETFLPLDRSDELQMCDCGRPATKQMSAPRVHGDFEGYSCPRSGKWVEGRRAHRENLARTGCRLFEPGERQQHIDAKRNEERAFDKAIDATVSAALDAMPSRDKELLASEVQGGADVQLTRSTL